MSLFHYSIKETAIGYCYTHLLMVSNLYHAELIHGPAGLRFSGWRNLLGNLCLLRGEHGHLTPRTAAWKTHHVFQILLLGDFQMANLLDVFAQRCCWGSFIPRIQLCSCSVFPIGEEMKQEYPRPASMTVHWPSPTASVTWLMSDPYFCWKISSYDNANMQPNGCNLIGFFNQGSCPFFIVCEIH